MSKIDISREELCEDVVTILDEKNEPKHIKYQKQTFIPTDKTCIIQTDYKGNIYIKFGETYYMVSLDHEQSSGIVLTPILKPESFRKNLEENIIIKKHVKSGVIKSGTSTLSGRVAETLDEMDDEEKEDYMSKNDYASYDAEFMERRYYRVKYADEDNNDLDVDDEPDINLDGDEDAEYNLNGISDPKNPHSKGIVFSDLLASYHGSFDTIMIDGDTKSQSVTSTVERRDEYCTSRLTIYSSGHLRTNFIDRSIMSKLCIDSELNELIAIKIILT